MSAARLSATPWTTTRLRDAIRKHEIEASTQLRMSIRCRKLSAHASAAVRQARAEANAVAAGRLSDVLTGLILKQWGAAA